VEQEHIAGAVETRTRGCVCARCGQNDAACPHQTRKEDQDRYYQGRCSFSCRSGSPKCTHHCERSEAIQERIARESGLLRRPLECQDATIKLRHDRIFDRVSAAMGRFVFRILVVAFLFWAEQAQGPQIASAQEHPGNAGAQTEQHKSFWQRTTDDPIALYTLVLSVFTGLLVVVTGGLTWVGARQVSLTKDIANRQTRDTQILQRAYLSVEPGGVAPYASPTTTHDPDWRVVAHIRIHNAGHLPARNVNYHFNTEFSTDPHWSEERLTHIDWSEDYFGQSGETENAVGPVGNNVVPPASAMNQGGPTRLLHEKGWVYVWGKVTYHDGFVGGRVTRFCHRYNLKRFESNKRGARRIRPKYGRHYERGNDAT
jgi:hypothetical protein